jgi:LPS export ABC transporter protein LptC
MSWQKKARLAIIVFVVGFATVVFLAMQRSAVPVAPAESPRTSPDAVSETLGPVKFDRFVAGKLDYSLTGRDHKAFEDGRQELTDVTLEIPDRNGRALKVTGARAEVRTPPGKPDDLAVAKFTGKVRLTSSDGLAVNTEEATYDGQSGLLTVPGPLTFAKGRMNGSGVGATYDRDKDVLWILNQARVNVAPDAGGEGAAEATAGAAGLARAENYMKLVRAAHIVAGGRTIDSDDTTILLKEDGETIRQMQLRGNSRIVGAGEGTQSMSAADIDLMYADDGRTLQSARLMQNAVLELPVAGGGARRITGQTIDFALAADGATVSSLTAVGGVVMDLPAEGPGSAKHITATTLNASGPASEGVQRLTFEGPVEFRETKPAGKGTAAVERTARAARLIVDTKSGLGSIERADFRGNVRITDGADVTAGAPRAVYHLTTEDMELSPSGNEAGPVPFVNDSQVLVEARHIRFSPATRGMAADTDVRSTILARRKDAEQKKPGNRETRLPSMLSPDQPVTVTSNRMKYDGKSVATYEGNARLWQDKSKVYAETIEIDDGTGNLTARTQVRTTMILDDVDPKTKQKRATETNATSDVMVYDDAKRIAVYTAGPSGRAHIVGAQGDLTADRTELYLREGGRELERAVSNGNVIVKEGARTATGAHLVYTAATDTYVMTGRPVEIIEREGAGCKKTVGAKLTFNRSNESVRMENDGLQLVDGKSIPCPAGLGG